MKTHRHLFAWRKAWASAVAIHRFADAAWSPQRRAVFDQLRRAALSVPLNIAEGYASGRGARCRYLLRVSYASAVETTELLRLLAELGEPQAELEQVSREVQALTLLLLRKSR
ncbi:MAG: four helix bundle protein [Gemmatimonadales bacterium]|nr:four helix bundle protein [Gemmatimonadales bacterium]